jgi:hypothetical protein
VVFQQMDGAQLERSTDLMLDETRQGRVVVRDGDLDLEVEDVREAASAQA